jgi:hypothetical protein
LANGQYQTGANYILIVSVCSAIVPCSFADIDGVTRCAYSPAHFFLSEKIGKGKSMKKQNSQRGCMRVVHLGDSC